MMKGKIPEITYDKQLRGEKNVHVLKRGLLVDFLIRRLTEAFKILQSQGCSCETANRCMKP
ncbi:hypothetical protein BCT56_23280 [Vibrio lentus]|uniref:Transposase DDE domain-containing protein n=1 Tax=Vibrio lentus TaxID=136468 RepID=A0AB36XQI6_9VIBR|nr:hypothetical protein BCT99_11375 [Vibrio lentus]PMM42661.1 hypothetical protein BCT56_23280 [Vibrio lentus]